MSHDPQSPAILRPADLPVKRPTPFDITVPDTHMTDIAARLGVLGIKKLRFAGSLAPMGKADWHLSGMLGASVVQECVVTLEPVNTRIDETVERIFLQRVERPENLEDDQMPDDDTVEELPEEIDLMAILEESLALALPAYPRSPSAEALEISVTEPGKTPLSDADVKPFAGLAALRDKLSDEGS